LDHPFDKPVIQLINEEWLATLAGTLVGILAAAKQPVCARPEGRAARFSDNYLPAPRWRAAMASLTDFMIHADEFSRMLVMDMKLGKRQAGRVQRLLEIEPTE
jgi:uncharacterized membrane-anchored protein